VASQRLVHGWWEYQRRLHGNPEERRALEAGHPAEVHLVFNEVKATISAGGLRAWDLVVALLDVAPGDPGVMLVGAGPLEDLVKKHGDALVKEIEYDASRNDRVRQALSCVWVARGLLTPEVEGRLSRWISS
jgi:hypothetical protein